MRVEEAVRQRLRAEVRPLGCDQLGISGLNTLRLTSRNSAFVTRPMPVAVGATVLEVRLSLRHQLLAFILGEQIGYEEDPWVLVDCPQSWEIHVDGEMIPVR